LDLSQQTRLRVVVQRWRISEQDSHAVAFELFEHQDLIRVDASQAVGSQTEHGLEQACLRLIPEAVQSRSIQACTGMTVIQELGHHFVFVMDRPGAEDFELRGDGASSFLDVSGDAGVERDSHVDWPHVADRPHRRFGVLSQLVSVGLVNNPKASARASKRGSSNPDQRGRCPPTTVAIMGAAADGLAIRAARPRWPKRAAARSSCPAPSSACSRNRS
jgi:hypothetical protein